MSWDVLIFRFEGTPEEFASLPADYRPDPLGSSQAIRDSITDIWPTTDWSDPEWGWLQVDAYSIEFQLGESETAETLSLSVRPSRTGVSINSSAVGDLLSTMGLQASQSWGCRCLSWVAPRGRRGAAALRW